MNVQEGYLFSVTVFIGGAFNSYVNVQVEVLFSVNGLFSTTVHRRGYQFLFECSGGRPVQCDGMHRA